MYWADLIFVEMLFIKVSHGMTNTNFTHTACNTLYTNNNDALQCTSSTGKRSLRYLCVSK